MDRRLERSKRKALIDNKRREQKAKEHAVGIDRLDAKVDELDAKIDLLDNKIDEYESRIDNLEDRIEALEEVEPETGEIE